MLERLSSSINKAVVLAVLTILWWIWTGLQTGDWTLDEVVKGAVATFFVWLVPNATDG